MFAHFCFKELLILFIDYQKGFQLIFCQLHNPGFFFKSETGPTLRQSLEKGASPNPPLSLLA